jgi:hypothetical protein
MSVNEWAQVDLGMSAHQVQVIADGPGTEGPVQHSGPHQGDYNIDWPACWDSSKKTRAWFNNATDILVDKNVIDA